MKMRTIESALRRRGVQLTGAALIGLLIGGGVVGLFAADQRQMARAATERAYEAKSAFQRVQKEAARAEAAAAERAVKAKAKADAAAATIRASVATRLAEADKLKADAAAEAAKQQAELDARAAALTGAEAEAMKNEFEGSGIYRIGADIAPGTYKSEGTDSCYYARLSSLTAEGIDGIIDNNNVSGPVVIQVRASDVALEVKRCGTFRKVG